MFAEAYRVSDVLMLVGNLFPLALYFLVLGLVNSHARPRLISSRADFLALSSALGPLLLWPLPWLAASGQWWPLLFGASLAIGLFAWLLPRRDAGFVVYNVAAPICEQFVRQALRRIPLDGQWDGAAWHAVNGEVSIYLRRFGLLRNVAVHVEARSSQTRWVADALADDLQRRFQAVAQLPSPMGACLVVMGLGLMILPMWMVGRHIHDIVDAMSHIFG